MTSTQVQRTLVKSAPEIWAELSDPGALARHLDPVGEIRITRAEPEQKVEWEAAGARGTVLIKPSGWGTRVTLTMSRDDAGAVGDLGQANPPNEPETVGEPAAQPAVASEPDTTTEPAPPTAGASEGAPAGLPGGEPEPAAAPDSTASPEPETALEATSPPEPKPLDETDGEPASEDAVTSPLVAEAPAHRLELPPRRGFLARLVGRRRREARQPSSGDGSLLGLAVQSPGVGPWPTASAEWVDQFPRREPDSELAPAVAEPEPSLEDMLGEPDVPADDAAASVEEAALGSEESVDAPSAEHDAGANVHDDGAIEDDAGSTEQDADSAGQDAAVLCAVLDRLGAAHHRPFSRA